MMDGLSGVAFHHVIQRNGLDVVGVTGTTKGFKARFANAARGLARRNLSFAGIELAAVLRKSLAHRTRHRQADVGVDVDLAHT